MSNSKIKKVLALLAIGAVATACIVEVIKYIQRYNAGELEDFYEDDFDADFDDDFEDDLYDDEDKEVGL